jgi:hypothetical protein
MQLNGWLEYKHAPPTPRRPRVGGACFGAESRHPNVHPPRWNGVTLCLPWAEAQGYVRTPFHGGRIARWKLVNSLTKIPASTVAPGKHTVVSRGIDAKGNVQPSSDDDEIALKKTYWEAYQQWPREIEV